MRRVGILHTDLEEVGDDLKMGGELTGRILHIPNLSILDLPIVNYTKEYSSSSGPKNVDYVFDEVRIPVTATSDVSQAKAILEDILSRSDKVHLQAATVLFGNGYDAFMREAESTPKVQVYLEPSMVWLKGKFVVPISDRNSLRTQIVLEFLSETQKLNGRITLA